MLGRVRVARVRDQPAPSGAHLFSMSKVSSASKPRVTRTDSFPALANAFVVGERVRVLCGALEGTSGVVISVKSENRYMLAIDGLPRGVYVVVEERTLAAATPPSPR